MLQDEQGRWNKFGGRLPWDQSAICCNNGTFGGTGRHKTGEDYVAAPNIDHTQVGGTLTSQLYCALERACSAANQQYAVRKCFSCNFLVRLCLIVLCLWPCAAKCPGRHQGLAEVAAKLHRL